MFTGLIEVMGTVREIRESAAGRRLVIDPGPWDHVPDPGASIAVSGCCLTVVSVGDTGFAFDVIHRSLEMTTLGDLREGDRVNLERAATMSTLLGGHLVQGHVDGTGRVEGIDDGDDWRMRIEGPVAVTPHLVDRGSIAIDGVSLTIARVLRDHDDRPRGLEVALIPETLERTTLSSRQVGDRVNLEADAMAKMVSVHVERLLAARDD